MNLVLDAGALIGIDRDDEARPDRIVPTDLEAFGNITTAHDLQDARLEHAVLHDGYRWRCRILAAARQDTQSRQAATRCRILRVLPDLQRIGPDPKSAADRRRLQPPGVGEPEGASIGENEFSVVGSGIVGGGSGPATAPSG